MCGIFLVFSPILVFYEEIKCTKNNSSIISHIASNREDYMRESFGLVCPGFDWSGVGAPVSKISRLILERTHSIVLPSLLA